MTLYEMSAAYSDGAALIHGRIQALKAAAASERDPDERFRLQSRIDALAPLLRKSREMAVLTAHYYDRSYHRYEKYAI